MLRVVQIPQIAQINMQQIVKCSAVCDALLRVWDDTLTRKAIDNLKVA